MNDDDNRSMIINHWQIEDAEKQAAIERKDKVIAILQKCNLEGIARGMELERENERLRADNAMLKAEIEWRRTEMEGGE